MLRSIDSADRLSRAADLVAAVALQIPEAISLVLRRSRLPRKVPLTENGGSTYRLKKHSRRQTLCTTSTSFLEYSGQFRP